MFFPLYLLITVQEEEFYQTLLIISVPSSTSVCTEGVEMLKKLLPLAYLAHAQTQEQYPYITD